MSLPQGLIQDFPLRGHRAHWKETDLQRKHFSAKRYAKKKELGVFEVWLLGLTLTGSVQISAVCDGNKLLAILEDNLQKNY